MDGEFSPATDKTINSDSSDIRILCNRANVSRWFGGALEFAPPGRLFAANGRMVVDGAIMTDTQTGERWRYRDGAWVKTWTHKRAETRHPQGRARYERRVARGAR